METDIRIKSTVLISVAFVFFYLGDIITTFLVLENGGHELNRFMAAIGFGGFVIFKTFLILIFGLMVYYLDRFKFYRESGIIIGMVLMSGLLATLFNMGFFSFSG
ncbi:Uncharacterised protein [uncultured archaeon]|nr:Uncharacterised protein [uncultured archaeon]